ncbi:hypothetical protein GGH96_001273 [Coemansia sp. RSA 1972]|nr:hypothetical protein GGH96_001273 [Coemansia sp. RSA 1972]
MAGVDTTVPHRAGETTANTAELTKMIRTAGEALDQALQTPNVDYFGTHLEGLRNDILELFRRLLVRNPFSSHRKDAVSKMWFRTIYPTIEQYRAKIRLVENAGRSTDNAKPSDADAVEARRQVSQWRARLHTFLHASTGTLLRLVAELAEAHALMPSASGVLDRQTLDTHVWGLELVDSLKSELHVGLTPVQRATLALVSKLLTHLGDLARYRTLYARKTGDDTERAWQLAKGFYRSAIRVAPHRGQAHNQLAVIFGYERNSLDGVFAYYRALTSQYGFAPADANLRTLLDHALRAVDKAGACSVDATTGYVYCEQRMYDKFTMLRYLFAHHQPQAKETVKQLAPLDANSETILAAEVRRACMAFVRGITSGAIEERQAVMAHAIQLFEQQQLACFNVGDKETRLHDTAIARVSAMSVALTAQLMSQSVRTSITESMRRARELKSEADLMSRSSRRVVAPLIATLLWLVSACVRVDRDSDSLEHSVTQLKSQMFCAVRDHGLQSSIAQLKQCMEDAHARVNRRSPLVQLISWTEARASMPRVAARLWSTQRGQRTEDELAGWQLPDGTVWARVDSSVPRSAAPGGNDVHRVRWWQLHCLLALADEALPYMMELVEKCEASDETDAETDAEGGIETICFQGRPGTLVSEPSVAVPEPSVAVPEPSAAVPEPSVVAPEQVVAVPESPLPKRNATMSESQRPEQATPLVDTERDEVVSPAMRAHQMLNMQQSRQAIGAQRVAGNQQSVASGPLYSMQPVTLGPLYSMPSASGPLYSAEPVTLGPLYSVQTTLAQPPPSEQLEPPAMHVWQQYQMEHQRKVALQQQLEEQHRIQQMLHYQLLAQQQQQHALRNPMMREARSFDLDATTASVVSMALSVPQDKLSIYQQYSAMNIATPTMTAQTASLVPSLHPSLSLSSVASSAYPWTSPMLMPTTRNIASRDLDFGLQPMPAPYNRVQNVYGANPMYYSGVPLNERL